jgi:hypothetical protein
MLLAALLLAAAPYQCLVVSAPDAVPRTSNELKDCLHAYIAPIQFRVVGDQIEITSTEVFARNPTRLQVQWAAEVLLADGTRAGPLVTTPLEPTTEPGKAHPKRSLRLLYPLSKLPPAARAPCAHLQAGITMLLNGEAIASQDGTLRLPGPSCR